MKYRQLVSLMIVVSLMLLFTSCRREGSSTGTKDKPKFREIVQPKMIIGDRPPLPDVKMKNVDGSWLSINDVRGKKGTLVVFTSNSCSLSTDWNRELANLGNYFNEQGGGVVFLNSNDPGINPLNSFDNMKIQAIELDIKFPYLVDASSDIARNFLAVKTPEVFLFDQNLQLVYHGSVSDDVRKNGNGKGAYLRNAVDALLAGTEIPVPETDVTGCDIVFRPPI